MFVSLTQAFAPKSQTASKNPKKSFNSTAIFQSLLNYSSSTPLTMQKADQLESDVKIVN
jgi:hypothetical protein